MVKLNTIKPRWNNEACIVAATGPSLTAQVAEHCKGRHVIAVNDAYRLFPFAEVLYACDARWWDVHKGCPGFSGEKWSSHSEGTDDKRETAEKYGLLLIAGTHDSGFSYDPQVIHYGDNSGFQAVNLAILFGASPIILVGFDMRSNGRRHFFGDHPPPLTNNLRFEDVVHYFTTASASLPEHVRIVNCTPDSALTCFPTARLEDV